MQDDGVLNVSSQGMQGQHEIIVVIGKRKLYDSQFIEALKSKNVFDVVTSESRKMKKPNKMQFQEEGGDFFLTTTTIAVSLLCDSVANTAEKLRCLVKQTFTSEYD